MERSRVNKIKLTELLIFKNCKNVQVFIDKYRKVSLYCQLFQNSFHKVSDLILSLRSTIRAIKSPHVLQVRCAHISKETQISVPCTVLCPFVEREPSSQVPIATSKELQSCKGDNIYILKYAPAMLISHVNVTHK